MAKKLLKISLLILILFFCVAFAYTYWFFQTDGKSKICKEFCSVLEKKLLSGKRKVIDGESTVVILENTIGADTCVICRSYLPSYDELVSEMVQLGVREKVAKKIAFKDRWVEGCFLYFSSGDKIICESHLSYIDASKDIVSRKTGDRIKFILRFDPKQQEMTPDDVTLDPKVRTVVIEHIE